MKTFALFAALAALACSPQKKVDRPTVPDTVLDDQCGDSSPGCPRDTLPTNPTKDTFVVDSGQAVRGWPIFRTASYGATMAVDSSTYVINYVRLEPLAALDTIQVWFRRDSTATVPKVSTSKYFRTLKGSATFKVTKIYNTKATYRACVRVRSNARISSDMCQVWNTNFVQPPPGPVDTVKVDSTLAIAKLDVKPDAPHLVFGQKQQFCAYVVFKDQKVALRTQDKGVPECDEMYKGFTLTQRDLTIKQQQAADSVCVKWKAEGGSITAEVCEPNNPLVGHQT